VEWNESLTDKLSIVITRYTDQMKFSAYMAVSFITFFYILLILFCIAVFMVVFCVLLFNCVNYVFLLLCMFRLRYSVSLCCSVCCLCVNVYCTIEVCGSVHLGNMFNSSPTRCTLYSLFLCQEINKKCSVHLVGLQLIHSIPN
jgi:hypothetical protein